MIAYAGPFALNQLAQGLRVAEQVQTFRRAARDAVEIDLHVDADRDRPAPGELAQHVAPLAVPSLGPK